MKHSYTSPDQAAKQLVSAFDAQGKEITTWAFDTFYLRAVYSLQLQI